MVSETAPWLTRNESAPFIVRVEDCPRPACDKRVTYARELDRYVHRDGTSNRECWAWISRGGREPNR